MILGMTPVVFVHVVLSLVGIGSGIVFVYGLLTDRRLEGCTTVFLASTVATSVSGFAIPADRFTPGHAFGIVSLVALAAALLARYPWRLAGGWRTTYLLSSLAALYLNVFVLVVQAFLKVPALHALAPTGSEAPFAIAQLLVLVSFVALGALVVGKSRQTLALSLAG